MTLKTLVTALTLVVLPASAYATCSGKHSISMSCAEGTVWSIEAQTCVKAVSS